MGKMKSVSRIKIVDVTGGGEFEKYLYKCLAPMPFRRYGNRREYLESAVPEGFHKVLIFNREVFGTIEYAPAEASGYPIMGDDVIVMNCVWILRKAKRHDVGKLLVENMVNSEMDARGFATIGLDNHWSHGLGKVR